MSQVYSPLNIDNLLIFSSIKDKKTVHECFLDHHVLNMVEDNTYSGNSPHDILAFIGKDLPARIKKINEELDNLRLYKFIDIRSLSYMLQDSRLYLDRVTDAWEDPYENYFLKENLRLEDGTKVSADNNLPGVFGQSWTFREETDAMWRIYSQDDVDANGKHKRNFHGVRIETTARKLLNVIYVDDDSMADTWIGKVLYLELDEINKRLQGTTQSVRDDLGKSFFIKRQEFDHESEFRVMKLMDSSTIAQTENYKRIAFAIPSITDFIDSYTLDPRLSPADYAIIKNDLINMCAEPAMISRSILYHFDPVEVTIDF